ncbi:MAG: hypothetical protein RLZZ401_688 [Pseudomonadota bacterium]
MARIPILTYHQIADAPARGAPLRSLYVSPAAFARQMWMLTWLGYQGLGMSALMPYLEGKKTGKVVGITFDDGYLNNLTQAMPVLQHHGFSATCYCVSQRLGQTNAWDKDVGIAPTPLMNEAQLRQWVAGGQEIGAHTRHHVHLRDADAAAAELEIAGAKADLEAVTGRAVPHFCYPYGEFNASHTAMVRQAGYETATTTERGRCNGHDDLFALPRVPVVRTTTLAALWLKIATPYEDRRSA